MATTKYTYVKHQGTWKDPKNVFIRQQGTWTSCKGIYYKRNGEWELVWPTRAATFTGSTTSVDFTTTLNQTSVKKRITITNSGDTDLRIYSISTSTPTKFTIAIDSAGLGGTPSQQTPRTIAPGSSAYFEASITATLLTGEDTGTITVEFYKNIINETGSSQVAVTGTVNALSATATLDKTSLSFSASLTKASSAQTVKITNSGRETLRITGITATTPTKYTIDTNFSGLGGTPSVGSPISIAPGADRNFQVSITAGSSEGTDSGTITIGYLTDLLGTSVTQTISVSGTVNKLSAALTATPSSLTFSALEVSQQSSVQTVTLKNTGTDVLTVNSITPSTPSRFTINVNQKTAESGGIGTTLPTTIAAGASKTIDVRITAGTSAGSDSGTVSIGSTVDVLGGTSTTTVGVSGSVSLTQGLLTFSRNSVTLSAKQGLSSEKVKITVTNNSTISITNISLNVSQQLNASYGTIFTTGDLPSTLAVGQSATVEVYFTAAAAAATGGSNSGTVKFSYVKNAAGAIEEKSIGVACGVTAPVSSYLFIPSPKLSLGTVKPNDSGSFSIQNTGTTNLTITLIEYSSPFWYLLDVATPIVIGSGSTRKFPFNIRGIASPGTYTGNPLKFTFTEIPGGPVTYAIEGTVVAGAGSVQLTRGASSPWTVPAGVNYINVIAIGGGAGGASGSEGDPWITGGAGGASGAVAQISYAVTPGQQIAFSIGAGGAGAKRTGGGEGFAGSAGGQTTFGALTASGGAAPTRPESYNGQAFSASARHYPKGGVAGAGGANGTDGGILRSSSSTAIQLGGRGGSVSAGGKTYGTGGSGSSETVGTSTVKNGGSATGFGAGGGGGSGIGGGHPAQGGGGDGAPGTIIISWD